MGGVVDRARIVLAGVRRRAGLTQAELAARAGVARTSLSMYESGAREPGADAFLRLIAAAGGRVGVQMFTDWDVKRGDQLVQLLELADALPSRWPGDSVEFPSRLWRSADGRA